jgi:hypothetical protein
MPTARTTEGWYGPWSVAGGQPMMWTVVMVRTGRLT